MFKAAKIRILQGMTQKSVILTWSSSPYITVNQKFFVFIGVFVFYSLMMAESCLFIFFSETLRMIAFVLLQL
jgi:hypothetical protein